MTHQRLAALKTFAGPLANYSYFLQLLLKIPTTNAIKKSQLW